MSEAVLWVCTSCRDKGGPVDREGRPGFRLHQRLLTQIERLAEAGVRLEGHKCLSACDRPCAVGFSGPRRWTYVFGQLDETEAVEALLTCARLYASSQDGFLERAARPQALQATIIARLPPV
jgi:predicted metal-binding protein